MAELGNFMEALTSVAPVDLLLKFLPINLRRTKNVKCK